jgi:hypothetical protein
MVYSKTTSQTGFYNVHVRKVYLRQGGGESAKSDNAAEVKLVPLEISEEELNDGKVIVDSGTTDTYFSHRMGGPFKTAWKNLVGNEYDHKPKVFTAEELARQPTILFQIQGDEDLNKQLQDRSPDGSGALPGLAGDVDPDHPYDVLLAVPPSHYYEYDPDEKNYVSRFYVDEGGGGVFGANSMMGHDVYFDVENYRVGWAESDCDYTNLVSKYFKGGGDILTPPGGGGGDSTSPTRVEPEGGGTGPTTTTTETKEHDDGGDEPAGSGEEEIPIPDGFCSSLACQGALLAAVVVGVVVVAARVVRRVPPAYDLGATSELELRTGPVVSAEEDDSGEFVNGIQYRDHAPEGVGYEDADEEEEEMSGRLS